MPPVDARTAEQTRKAALAFVQKRQTHALKLSRDLAALATHNHAVLMAEGTEGEAAARAAATPTIQRVAGLMGQLEALRTEEAELVAQAGPVLAQWIADHPAT